MTEGQRKQRRDILNMARGIDKIHRNFVMNLDPEKPLVFGDGTWEAELLDTLWWDYCVEGYKRKKVGQ